MDRDSLIGIGLVGAVCILLIKKWRNSLNLAHRDSRVPSLQITTSVSSRVYDPNSYRFDGLATPEWRIEYADANGEITARDIYVHRQNTTRDGVTLYDCWCFLRDERRSFRQDRMLSIVNLATGRRIKDIRKYRHRY